MPLVSVVYARKATFTPCTFFITTSCCWARDDGKDPVCAIPLLSRALPVSSMPDCPWSREWLEAVSHTSHPVALIPCASAGGVLKIG